MTTDQTPRTDLVVYDRAGMTVTQERFDAIEAERDRLRAKLNDAHELLRDLRELAHPPFTCSSLMDRIDAALAGTESTGSAPRGEAPTYYSASFACRHCGWPASEHARGDQMCPPDSRPVAPASDSHVAFKLGAQLVLVLAMVRRLRNEIDGLRAFEGEIRGVIGNTNWAVLRDVSDEAGRLLRVANQPDAGT